MSDRNAILDALADAVRSTPIPECQSAAAYHKWSKTIAAAVLELPEVKALVKAARPFYAAVFNDNGDVTISTGHITTGDWLALDTALAAIKEPKT